MTYEANAGQVLDQVGRQALPQHVCVHLPVGSGVQEAECSVQDLRRGRPRGGSSGGGSALRALRPLATACQQLVDKGAELVVRYVALELVDELAVDDAKHGRKRGDV